MSSSLRIVLICSIACAIIGVLHVTSMLDSKPRRLVPTHQQPQQHHPAETPAEEPPPPPPPSPGLQSFTPPLNHSASAISARRGQLDAACRVSVDVERQRLLHHRPASLCVNGASSQLCDALRRALAVPASASLAAGSRVVATIAHLPEQQALLETFSHAVAALQVPALALTVGDAQQDAFSARREHDLASTRALELRVVLAPLPGEATAPVLSRKWNALTLLLEAGVSVLYADVDALLLEPPFLASTPQAAAETAVHDQQAAAETATAGSGGAGVLHDDSDVEVLSSASDCLGSLRIASDRF